MSSNPFWCHQCRMEIHPRADFTCPQCGSDFIEEIDVSESPMDFVPTFTGPNTTSSNTFTTTTTTTTPTSNAAPRTNQPRVRIAAFSPFGGFFSPFGAQPMPSPTTGEPPRNATGGMNLPPMPEYFAQLVQQVFGVPATGNATGQFPPFEMPPAQVFFGFQPQINLNQPNPFTMLFQGLLGEEVPIGGDFYGGSFEQLLNHLFETAQHRTAPPASKAVVASLPRIRIEQVHIDQSEECPICKDNYSLGDEVIQLPCKHLYHPDCITAWLKDHNSCPVCRFELPTDDAEYEHRRQTRNSSDSAANFYS